MPPSTTSNTPEHLIPPCSTGPSRTASFLSSSSTPLPLPLPLVQVHFPTGRITLPTRASSSRLHGWHDLRHLRQEGTSSHPVRHVPTKEPLAVPPGARHFRATSPNQHSATDSPTRKPLPLPWGHSRARPRSPVRPALRQGAVHRPPTASAHPLTPLRRTRSTAHIIPSNPRSGPFTLSATESPMLSRWFDVNDDVSARVFAILTTKLPSTYKYFYNVFGLLAVPLKV